MTLRRTALETLMEITDKGAYANLALKHALSGMEERDAKWVSAAGLSSRAATPAAS